MLKLIISVALAVGITITPAMAQEAPSVSAWKVDEGETALTGAKSISAVLTSTKPLINMISQPENAALILRCRDGVMAAYISWPEVLAIGTTTFSGRPQVMVLWRIDDQPIAVNFWMRSDSGVATGMFETRPAMKLLEKLIVAHRLVVRLTGQTTQDAVFELGDINAIATRVGAPCGVKWRLRP